MQKLDPYINVDPGTMSPYQHGEVYVLDDGAETDLDLGHYERFIDIRLNRVSNFTTGQVYAEVIAKERRGDYPGRHDPGHPAHHQRDQTPDRAGGQDDRREIVLVEVGGTVGDIESQPFLEACASCAEVGRENTLFVHVTWLPYIGATGELKTKPTQHSVRELRSIGISPNMIIARSDYPVDEDLCDKIALFCDVDRKAVIPMVTTDVLYEVPLLLGEAGRRRLSCSSSWAWKRASKPDWSEWEKLVAEVRSPKPAVQIALVGKYVELQDAYMTVREALKHAALATGRGSRDRLGAFGRPGKRTKAGMLVNEADGILVPGGFGTRGIEGKIQAARYARENKVPYLGLCLGMQVMVIEFARNVLGHEDANSTEFDRTTRYPVIDLMPDQRDITDMGGTMRLGLYPCELQPGTQSRSRPTA